MRDYRGHGKASKPMLPSIGDSDDGRHRQRGAVVRADLRRRDAREDGVRRSTRRRSAIAILDPALTVSQPAAVTAIAGYDALSHAVESYVTRAADDRVGALCARGLAAARGELRAGADAIRAISTARGAMLLGRALSGRRDRAVDARRDARVRQSADRTIRHDARRRDRRHAAARGPLERDGRRRPLRGVTCCVGPDADG